MRKSLIFSAASCVRLHATARVFTTGSVRTRVPVSAKTLVSAPNRAPSRPRRHELEGPGEHSSAERIEQAFGQGRLHGRRDATRLAHLLEGRPLTRLRVLRLLGVDRIGHGLVERYEACARASVAREELVDEERVECADVQEQDTRDRWAHE